MNFFLPATNALKNLGGEEIVLKIFNHFAKMGGPSNFLSIFFQFCHSAAKAYLAS